MTAGHIPSFQLCASRLPSYALPIHEARAWISPCSLKTLKVKGETDMLIKTKERLTTEITSLKATKQTFTWKSSNSKILKVNSKGEVKAVGLGVATITASTVDGSKRKEKVRRL